MPLDCGSTSVSTIWTAMAASTAVPPAASTSYPASTASGLAAVTIHESADHPGLSVHPDAASGACGTVARSAQPRKVAADSNADAMDTTSERKYGEGDAMRRSIVQVGSGLATVA